MRIRVVIEYDVDSKVAAKGYAYVKRHVRELVESWPSTFKGVFLSVEKVEKPKKTD